MPIPEPPVDFASYAQTLSDYNQAADELQTANSNRNNAFLELQAAQSAYDAANASQVAATEEASIKFGLHTDAAAEIGVEPAATGPPVPTPYRKRA